jgi:hypothetical protein
MPKKIGMKCKQCGKQYRLGYNGVASLCDKCAGIQRDADDNIWMPGETYQMRQSVSDGSIRKVTRKEAFG